MKKLVMVVFGGESWEREGSIISASAVARSLDRQKIKNRLVEFPVREIDLANKDVAIFNSIHGKNGEDGTLSALCESFGVPYNFSAAFAHAVGFDKLRFKSLALSLGIQTPHVLNKVEVEKAEYPLPIAAFSKDKKYILKPLYGGGSRGVQIVMPREDINVAISSREVVYDPYLIEEFVEGSFITCAISGDEEIDSSLPLLEARFTGDLYDYNTKHDVAKREYVLPAEISQHSESQIRKWSRKLFAAMGCSAIVRFDYLVSADGEVYLLEANTVPGLSEAGNLAAIWTSSGRSYDELISYLIEQIK